ncbi:MAG: PcfK-like family protein [Bacteroidota bacterium]|jgi:hypothetical protein
MKGTEHFKEVIKTYLDRKAEADVLFSFRYSKPEKNIDDCIQYILNTVRKSGCSGFSDEEIYSMAIHYYDEDNIEIGKSNSCKVVVNHTIELTEEEKAEARQKAVEQYQRDELAKIQSRNARLKKTDTTKSVSQPSLF